MTIYDLDTEILKPLYGIFHRIDVAPSFELDISYSNSTGNMEACLFTFDRSMMFERMIEQGFDSYVAEAILQCFDYFDISQFIEPQPKINGEFASLAMFNHKTLPVWEGGNGPKISLTMSFTAIK